jgi:hypothetical protein
MQLPLHTAAETNGTRFIKKQNIFFNEARDFY